MNYHGAADILTQILIDENIVTEPSGNSENWPCFTAMLAPKPDSAIGVTDIDVPTQGRLHRTGETVGPYGYQLRIRSKAYAKARNKAFELSQFFDTILRRSVTVDEKMYLVQAVHQEIRPTYIGNDDNDRANFTINGVLTIGN